MLVNIYSSAQYWLYKPPADMRKGLDSLCGLVSNELSMNPLNGDIFIFINGKRNQIKLLLWEKDGLSMYYKRLEKGTYVLAQNKDEQTHQSINRQSLLMLLEGIEWRNIKPRKRYSHVDK
jgi:transposase